MSSTICRRVFEVAATTERDNQALGSTVTPPASPCTCLRALAICIWHVASGKCSTLHADGDFQLANWYYAADVSRTRAAAAASALPPSLCLSCPSATATAIGMPPLTACCPLKRLTHCLISKINACIALSMRRLSLSLPLSPLLPAPHWADYACNLLACSSACNVPHFVAN